MDFVSLNSRLERNEEEEEEETDGWGARIGMAGTPSVGIGMQV